MSDRGIALTPSAADALRRALADLAAGAGDSGALDVALRDYVDAALAARTPIERAITGIKHLAALAHDVPAYDFRWGAEPWARAEEVVSRCVRQCIAEYFAAPKADNKWYSEVNTALWLPGKHPVVFSATSRRLLRAVRRIGRYEHALKRRREMASTLADVLLWEEPRIAVVPGRRRDRRAGGRSERDELREAIHAQVGVLTSLTISPMEIVFTITDAVSGAAVDRATSRSLRQYAVDWTLEQLSAA